MLHKFVFMFLSTKGKKRALISVLINWR